jgi:sortase A
VGLLALAEGAVTVTWQEPITAFTAHRQQQALAAQLEGADAALFSPDSLARLEKLKTERARMAALAGGLDRSAAPGDALGRIQIPKIGARFVFVAGATPDTLEKGPGHYERTVLPGQRGTVALAGHRTTYLAPFRKLDRLRHGDRLVLTMPYGRFSYSVEGSSVVSPSNASALRPIGYDRLVLTTCTPPFSAAKRLIVSARLESSVPLGPAVGDPFPKAL